MKKDAQALTFDHIAVCVGNTNGSLKKYTEMFKLLGFEQEWYRKKIGNSETAMKTAVMTRDKVKFALMEGIDGTGRKGKRIISQVNKYYQQFGFCVQHIALRCNNIEKLAEDWRAQGVRFLTEDKNHKPQILYDRDADGLVLQCFTYPIEKTWFFELKQVVGKKRIRSKKFEEFRDENVKGLWSSLNRALKKGWLFKINIFGKMNPSKNV